MKIIPTGYATAISDPKRAHRPPPTVHHGKVARWALKLTDAQVIELARRLAKVLTHESTPEPSALRLTLVDFARTMPKC